MHIHRPVKVCRTPVEVNVSKSVLKCKGLCRDQCDEYQPYSQFPPER